MQNDRRNLVLITGCSSGGKSTLLDALADRGYAVVPEPGRRIVSEEGSKAGDALPWVDLEKFARRAFKMCQADLRCSEADQGLVFFDRGVIDAAVALQFAGGPNYMETLGPKRHYSKKVFLAPPWREIYRTNGARKHGFEEAADEYQRLERALVDLGYEACPLPKVDVADRMHFVLRELS